MKICSQCGSAAFDDMEMCFECMTYFTDTIGEVNQTSAHAVARLQVALADYFNYELLLNKLEGRSLSVGSGSENAIVIPQEQVALHHLEVFYAHGHIWVESMDSSQQTLIGDTPLCGTVCLKPGIGLVVGDATITVLEE